MQGMLHAGGSGPRVFAAAGLAGCTTNALLYPLEVRQCGSTRAEGVRFTVQLASDATLVPKDVLCLTRNWFQTMSLRTQNTVINVVAFCTRWCAPGSQQTPAAGTLA
jgi:hypothetical protein